MNDYREVRINITPCSEDGTDVMAGLLADAGFESFVPDDKGLTAYIKSQDYDPVAVNNALAEYPFAAALDIKSSVVEGRDWNAEWEKNYFRPIVVGDRCVIHSTFHTDVPTAEYDIVIDPKMAFGTGHHATTEQVIRAILDMDETDKVVIDMGTGTGILAILCALRGAQKVTGIEIDEFAYINTLENVHLNNVGDKVSIINGDASALSDSPNADIFLANINRNVILNDIPLYVRNLNPGAVVVLSGFYEKDVSMIVEAAAAYGLTPVKQTVLNEWACVTLKNEK